VVAGEIGKLTEMTTKATKQISDKLKEINAKSNKASELVNYSNQLMKEGLDYTKKIDQSINDIIDTSNDVNSVIDKLTVRSLTQSKDIAEISQNVIDVISGVKTFLTAINVITERVENMMDSTDNMEQSINRFKLS